MLSINSMSDLLTALTIISLLLGMLLWLVRAQVVQFSPRNSRVERPDTQRSAFPTDRSSVVEMVNSVMKDKIDLIYDMMKESRSDDKEWRRAQAETNERLQHAINATNERFDRHMQDHIKEGAR